MGGSVLRIDRRERGRGGRRGESVEGSGQRLIGRRRSGKGRGLFLLPGDGLLDLGGFGGHFEVWTTRVGVLYLGKVWRLKGRKREKSRRVMTLGAPSRPLWDLFLDIQQPTFLIPSSHPQI